MGSTFDCIDVIREGIDGFVVRVVVLNRDFGINNDVTTMIVEAALTVKKDRLWMEGISLFVQMLDEGVDSALVTEVMTLVRLEVSDDDSNAGVQEGEFAQSPREDVERKLGHRKNFGIRQKGHLGTGFITITDHFERRFGHAALVTLTIFLSAAVDFDRQLDGERIDDRDTDAVKAAGNFVGIFVELSARVKRRHHDFAGRSFFGHVHVSGDAAAVVRDRHVAIFFHRDADLATETGQCFVDRVVDNFVNQMMKTIETGRSDIHRRAFSNWFESFQDFDRTGVVAHGPSF